MTTYISPLHIRVGQLAEVLASPMHGAAYVAQQITRAVSPAPTALVKKEERAVGGLWRQDSRVKAAQLLSHDQLFNMKTNVQYHMDRLGTNRSVSAGYMPVAKLISELYHIEQWLEKVESYAVSQLKRLKTDLEEGEYDEYDWDLLAYELRDFLKEGVQDHLKALNDSIFGMVKTRASSTHPVIRIEERLKRLNSLLENEDLSDVITDIFKGELLTIKERLGL